MVDGREHNRDGFDGPSPAAGGGTSLTVEEATACAARRSAPESGVRRVTEGISDNDLYAAFVEFLGSYGVARETEAGVIRLDIADDMYPTGLPAGLPLTVHLNRAQLRRLAWAEYDVSDDTDPDVIPRTTRYVEVGFGDLTFSLMEEFDSGFGDDAGVKPGHLVYDEAANRLGRREPPIYGSDVSATAG